MEFDDFVAGGVAAHQLDVVARTIQPRREQANEGFVGGRVHRGSGDFDAQFVAQGFADFVRRRARLQFD